MTDAGGRDNNTDDASTTHPVPLAVERRRSTPVDKRLVPKLLRVAGRIPFADDLAAAYFCAIDPTTPRKAKMVLFAALTYFVAPADAVPDIVAGLGFTDDATVLATALGIVGMHVKDVHRQAARRLLRLPQIDSEKQPGRALI